jgi:hypothetical protein
MLATDCHSVGSAQAGRVNGLGMVLSLDSYSFGPWAANLFSVKGQQTHQLYM